ncbi:two-component regulator propeller domain-containing protein [Arenimonas sp.]|uniref:hybrid sensor histidine kinase/response regulator n=1 Tax=Arenimonas sp. TaxID=1872635 RepID=UPI0039E6F102
MRSLFFWLGLVLGSAIAFDALAQNAGPIFRRIDVMDGLPANATSALALDRDGYLWIGTRDGLARYDGVSYRVYRYVPGDEGSLQGNYVFALWVDSKNRIWVGTEGKGLSMLDTDRRAFRHYRPDTHKLITNADVMAVVEDRRGNIWFGTYGGGLYRIDRRGGLTRFVPKTGNPNSLPSANVVSLAVDARGSLWVGTDAGLAQWGVRGFERIAAPLSDSVIHSLYADTDGSLWIGTSSGLDHRLPNGVLTRGLWKEELPHPLVTAVLRDRQGTRWVSTLKGVLRVDEEVVSVLGGRETPLSVLAMKEDEEGGIWFATTAEGIRRLPPGWRAFSKLGNLSPMIDGRKRTAVTPHLDRGFWLAGPAGFLEQWDPVNQLNRSVYPGNEKAFPSSVYQVIEREDGTVWSGGQGVLQRFDPVSGEVSWWYDHTRGGELLEGEIDQMLETRDGLLWVVVYGRGMQAIDIGGEVIQTILPGNGRGIDNSLPEQLGLGPDGLLWVSTQRGLWRWNGAAGRFEPVPGAPKDRVFGFTFLQPNSLWLHRMGLLEAYRWDGERISLVRRITSRQGMPAVESGGLAADYAGNLWLTTTRGLLRFDPTSNRLRMYGISDGLQSQEFETVQPPMVANGFGFASSGAGMLFFDPSKMGDAYSATRLAIDSISIDRGEDTYDFSPSSSSIEWLPGDRDLSVIARLLSYTNPGAHRYRFRLHGYDNDWVETGSQGERVFSSLEPGNYRLEVSATGTSGEWSEPKGFEVAVRAPWWRTNWARALAALLVLVVFWAVASAYRARAREKQTNALREQRRELSERASEAKTHFLATLGHEIRTPMTGVLGMTELLLAAGLPARQQAQAEAIRRSGQHLLRLMNDSLDLSRIEAGKLDLLDAPFDPRSLLEDCAEMLSPLAAAKEIAFTLQTDPGLPGALRGDADRVRQILLNLGNNAIKFTERGEVAIRGRMTTEGLAIEVSDTGPGLSEEQKSRLFQRFEQAEGAKTMSRYGGSGLGLAICRELTAAMGGRIEISSRPREGATFHVLLPLPVAEPAHIVAPVEVTHMPSGRLRILIVEDDPIVAEVVTGLLQNLGHETQQAAHGLDALARLSTTESDLAFVDLDLPGLDGFEVARLIRANGHTLPMVALTARADADAEPQAFAAGMNGFVRKPALAETLDTAIRAAVSPARARHAIAESPPVAP